MQATPVEAEVEGARVRGEHLAPVGPARGAVLLVHGFNSSRGEFGPLGAKLAGAGFHVLAFDQRGYGASEGEPGRTSVESAVQDILAMAWELRRLAPGLPMAVVGHSLGGAYALAALGRSDLFACGVVAHPVNRLFDELRPWEKLGYHLIGRRNERRMRAGKPSGSIPYKNTYESLFVSKDAARQARADGFLLGRVSLANYRGALTMDASAWARDVRVPVLVVASPSDKAVRHAHTRAVHDALPGAKAWFTHRGGHSCFRDHDGDAVAMATLGWLERHLGAATSDAAAAAPVPKPKVARKKTRPAGAVAAEDA